MVMSYHPSDQLVEDSGKNKKVLKFGRSRSSEGEFGLLHATTMLQEGGTFEQLLTMRDADRDKDQYLVQQDNQLRTTQSLSSTLNDPSLVEDEGDWWDYLESWVGEDGVIPVAPELIPDVKLSDFNGYLQRMVEFRTFFAENALELMAQEVEELGGEFDESGTSVQPYLM